MPLSWLFGAIARARRAFYREGIFSSVKIAAPVIIVGNISVGGTGKTPLVIWIAQFLLQQGVRVALITRGYGGSAQDWPREVSDGSDAGEVGDEAVLLSSRTGAMVVAGPDRVASARHAIENGAQVIVSDDGLQHYRLCRDLEIAVVDGERRFGNGWLLPAGPLREPESRLQEVDLVAVTKRGCGTGARVGAREISVHHVIDEAICIVTGERRALQSFIGSPAHAVAGIGNPEGFFALLRSRGLTIDTRALPDHASITASDVAFGDDAVVLMTEKDAVKCARFATSRHWAVRLEVRFDDADAATLSRALKQLVAS